MLSLVFSFLRDLTSLICPSLFKNGLKYISSFWIRSFSIYYLRNGLCTKSNFPLNSLNSVSAFSCSLFFNSINLFCLITFNCSYSSAFKVCYISSVSFRRSSLAFNALISSYPPIKFSNSFYLLYISFILSFLLSCS
jgi:hypothetical protein